MCVRRLFQRIFKILPCRRKTREETRTVYIGHKVPDFLETGERMVFPSNHVVSSKYTTWNFIPKNLFEQFHRIANIYFLAAAIIQLVIKTAISPWTSILPLIFVISVTAIKQGYEDWLRHRADNEVNSRVNRVIRRGRHLEVKAMDIQVGDVVKVSSDSDIPCDLVLLSSSEPGELCYITTANLDGETNLKTFFCAQGIRPMTSESEVLSFCGMIECHQPTADFYRFVGRIRIFTGSDGSSSVFSLGPENVLLRGTRLKNIEFVYGCAIYTGQETKISLNSRYASHKYSRVERKMNRLLLIYVFSLLSFAIIFESLTIWFYSQPDSIFAKFWYIPEMCRTFRSLPLQKQMRVITEDFCSYVILCNYVIPISMYVTVELQKFFGSMFFEWDVDLFHAESNKPAKAKTSDLNEELGQVEYLFTDKTGTMTENDMQFRMCSVGGTVYEQTGNQLSVKSGFHPGVDSVIIPTLTSELVDLFIVLALCHTARVDCHGMGSCDFKSQDGRPPYRYQSSSPDEKALLEACQRFGIVYRGLDDGLVLLTVFGKERRFTVHHVLTFDSQRKRMSVIVSDENGSVMLLSKGAETAIFERVVEGNIEIVENHIYEFAKKGLRTLVVATRHLTPEEFFFYDSILNDAKSTLELREEKLAKVYDIVEDRLVLLGATAVEDRLQEGVVETIRALREAGIKIWVVTGDKEETAVNVSYSAGHFDHRMNTMSLTKSATSAECGNAISCFLTEMEENREVGGRAHALVIDGRSLTFALEDHSDRLLTLCKRCVAVLCCRMTPLQKALIVRLVKLDKDHPTTASIGDGANDVSMIQESDVGLGIVGKEGRQAARYSDYTFARFNFLRKALLVHGHLFYRRIAIMVQYFFYKNVAMVSSQVYFTFFSAFSAQTLFSGFFLMFFNLTFTALPIMVFSLFEKHRSTSDLLNQPTLYRSIRGNELLSNWKFVQWNLLAIWHSLVFFFGALFAFQPGNSPFHNGKDYGHYDFGMVIMTVCVLTVNIKLILCTYNFNGIMVATFLVSIATYFVLTLVCCSLFWSFFSDMVDLHGTFQMMLSSPYVWFLILLLTVTALLPDFIIRAIDDTVDLSRRANTSVNVGDQPLQCVNRLPNAPPNPPGPLTNGTVCHRPIVRTPVKSWTFNGNALASDSPTAKSLRRAGSAKRDIAGSADSRRRLISASSADGSPSDVGVFLPMVSSRQSVSFSCGTNTTSFSESSTSCSSARRFLIE